MRYAALLLLSCAAIAAAGCGVGEGTERHPSCGSSAKTSSTVAHALQRAQADSRRARSRPPRRHGRWWLTAFPRTRPRSPAHRFSQPLSSAAKLRRAGARFRKDSRRMLTGPGAQLAGLLPELRAPDGPRLADDRLGDRSDRTRLAAAARFARANVALYIESVYDAHFTLAQIGKRLLGRLQQARRRHRRSGRRSRRRKSDALAAGYSEADRPAAPARRGQAGLVR